MRCALIRLLGGVPYREIMEQREVSVGISNAYQQMMDAAIDRSERFETALHKIHDMANSPSAHKALPKIRDHAEAVLKGQEHE